MGTALSRLQIIEGSPERRECYRACPASQRNTTEKSFVPSPASTTAW
jgi:hypothetical protein